MNLPPTQLNPAHIPDTAVVHTKDDENVSTDCDAADGVDTREKEIRLIHIVGNVEAVCRLLNTHTLKHI